jgi:hypothetical protein
MVTVNECMDVSWEQSSRHGELLDGCVHARWRDNARRTGSVLEGVHHTLALLVKVMHVFNG